MSPATRIVGVLRLFLFFASGSCFVRSIGKLQNRRRAARRMLRIEAMESRQLLAADAPFGATPVDTGEFLLGTVAVTPVFFESNGAYDAETQDWDAAEIDATLDKIRESVDWWTDMLASRSSVHTLDFVIDDTYARDPVETGYEPIDRISDDFQRYVGDWLIGLGYGDAPSIERAMHLFNDSQRQAHRTDWAFTIFVVDSSDDQNGFFASGGFNGAFAYPGGLFYVVPSGRPVSTYSHEMGHIFWARDEYPGAGSWTDMRGYYNAQNWNASDNPTVGFVQEDSIMRGGNVAIRAFETNDTPDTTLALVGWRDSDGDGIFDVADVPLRLDAIGAFDPETAVYSFVGSASVDTLPNQNSAGMQSDITLARVGALQYKLDDEVWQTALTPDSTEVSFELQIPISEPFSEIQWRAIDLETGIESNLLAGSMVGAVYSGAAGGVAFLDQNESGLRDPGERLLSATQFVVRRDDGSELYYAEALAADLPAGDLGTVGDLSLSSTGTNIDGRVAVLPASDGVTGHVFQAYDTNLDDWADLWNAARKLSVLSNESTGRVEIDFWATDTGSYGLDGGSYARVEAYDASGNLIDRLTSDLVSAGEQGRLVLQDNDGRIKRVIVYGHAETEIRVSGLRFGHQSTAVVDHDGAFSIGGLPDGSYSVELIPPKLIYQFSAPTIDFQITAGQAGPIVAAARRVDSPWYNADFVHDVNGDNQLTPRDALVVINEIARGGIRDLTQGEAAGLWLDTNNDGALSPLDALRVINRLIAHPGLGEGEQPVETSSQATPTSALESAGEVAATTNQLETERRAAISSAAVAILPTGGGAGLPLAAEQVDRVLADQGEGEGLGTANFYDPIRWTVVDSEGNPSSDQSFLKSASDSSLGADRFGRGDDGTKAADLGEFPVNSQTDRLNAISVRRHL